MDANRRSPESSPASTADQGPAQNQASPSELDIIRAALQNEMQGRTRAEAEVMDLQRELAALRARAFTPSTEASEDGQVEEQQIEDLVPTELDDQVTVENERLRAELLQLQATLNNKEMLIAKLEKERAIKEPLFQVGVDVRMACLERAKEVTLGHYRADSAIIEKRNAAIYEGNWKADISLFHTKLVTCYSRPWYTPNSMIPFIPYEVWVKMYGILPANYASSLLIDSALIEHMNLGFTIFSAKLPDGPALTARQNVAASVIANFVEDCHENDRSNDELEDDHDEDEYYYEEGSQFDLEQGEESIHADLQNDVEEELDVVSDVNDDGYEDGSRGDYEQEEESTGADLPIEVDGDVNDEPNHAHNRGDSEMIVELDDEGFEESSSGQLAKLQAIQEVIVQNDLRRR